MLSTGRPVAIRRIRPADPDHEELIQVAREDRQEPDPLQQREGLVLGELEHPLVEPQPAFLAVEVAAGRKIGPLLVAPSAGLAGRTADRSSWALMPSRLSSSCGAARPTRPAC